MSEIEEAICKLSTPEMLDLMRFILDEIQLRLMREVE